MDLNRPILCPTNALVQAYSDAGITNLPADEIVLSSSTAVEPHTLRSEGQENPISEYTVPEMNNHFRPSGALPHCLIVKKHVPVTMTRNTIFRNLFNGMIFTEKGFKRRALKLAYELYTTSIARH